MMNRPYVILHMLISIDGKITGKYMDEPTTIALTEEYYRINREYKADAYCCGRVTMEGSFTGGAKPDLTPFKNIVIERKDKIQKKWGYYAISIDPHGRLGWYGSEIKDYDIGYDNAHIIEILTDNVSDEHIAFLESKGISYLFCGNEKVDVNLMLKKLYEGFGIKTIMLEGGGLTDTLFLNAGVIDELSLVVVPTIDGDCEGKDLFSGKTLNILEQYKIKDVKLLPNNGLWLNYVK